MRALILPSADSTVTLSEIDLPDPGDGEVRVRIHAASVNGFDLAVAGGGLVGMMEHRFPVVIGKDFAGVVDAVGAGVDDFTVGDRVFGIVTKDYLGDGSFAEHVVVPAATGIAQLPDSLDFAAGATLGLAGAAAVQAADSADLASGRTVLVVGATGGVGNRVLQLAARAGATAIATAHSEEEIAQVTGLGAASTLDYHADPVAQLRELHPDGVDVVIHLAGDPASWLPAVSRGGRLVSTLIMSPEQLPSDDVTVVPVYAAADRAVLDRVAALAVSGETKVPVHATFPLDEAPAALDAFRAGTRGKIVITVA